MGVLQAVHAGLSDPRHARGDRRGAVLSRLAGPGHARFSRRLLLRAGHVVPTEQLVDELYGAEPPKIATASLQNSVAALRKALGPDVLRHARARTILLAVPPEQIDARRFELPARRTRATALRPSGAPSCSVGSRSGVAHRLPSLRSRHWAETEARRLDDLRLVAVEERIAADIDLGPGRPTSCPSSTRSPASTRSASAVCELHMLALYRAGRQADALGAYAHCHARRSPSSVSSRAKGSRELQSKILRHDPGALPRDGTGATPTPTPTSRSTKAILSGRLVPVLGLDGAADSPQGLAVPSSDTRPSGRSTSRASLSTSRR